MWIFLADAFISLTALPGQPSLARVRARHPDHISNLFPDCDQWEYMWHQMGPMGGHTDYKYQASVPVEEVKRVISERIDQLAINSFKDQIEDPVYFDACCRVRQDIHAIQVNSPWSFLNAPEWQ